MNLHTRTLITATACVSSTLFFLLLAPVCKSATTNSFAIRHVRVFDGNETLADADVVVEDGLIESVAKDATIPVGLPVVDGSGKTLLPGLIDAHVHTWGASRRDALRFGVTTELDMFSDWHLLAEAKRSRQSLESTDQSDLWSSGTLATVADGHGTEYDLPVPTLNSAGEAQAWVDARIQEGSDYIKIIREDGSEWGVRFPTLSDDEVAALIKAAHARGKMAMIHIAKLEDARLAVDDGVDGLAHVFMDKPADADFIQQAQVHHTFVVATLSLYAGAACAGEAQKLLADPRIAPYLSGDQKTMLGATWPGCSRDALSISADNVRRLHAGGIPVLAGTDSGTPASTHGASLHGELELLVAAGLTPSEALAAATSLPTEYFHLKDRGRIAPGLRADLLLVNGDPTRDITATRDIAAIYKNGYKVERRIEAPAAASASAPEASTGASTRP